jgi:hypothetical protein
MRPNGTVDCFAMVRSLMNHPREVRALAETARDTFAAGITLSRVCSVFRSCNEPDVRSQAITLKGAAMDAPLRPSLSCVYRKPYPR